MVDSGRNFEIHLYYVITVTPNGIRVLDRDRARDIVDVPDIPEGADVARRAIAASIASRLGKLDA